MDNVVGGIEKGVGKLLGGLSDLLKGLFVPRDGYFQERIDEIRSEFVLMDSVMATVDEIQSFFNESSFDEAPKISINMGNSRGQFNYGKTSYALDLSWYKEYKPSVDIILSGIMWLFFIWRVFIGLPSILGGVGTSISFATDVQEANLKGGKK